MSSCPPSKAEKEGTVVRSSRRFGPIRPETSWLRSHTARLRRTARLGFLTIGLTAFFACAHYPVNPRLDDATAAHEGPHVSSSPRNSEELLLVLAFSGGGTRAAALAYGVLEALSQIEIPAPAHTDNSAYTDRRHTLLDEVDVISSVSGGSFTAAYYALHKEQIFDDFEHRLLYRNLNLELLLYLLSPVNWFRLSSPYFGRGDLAAEYYDRILFDGATFGDIPAHGQPAVFIQATDIVDGNHFGFIPFYFDMICSDLSEFPISRAVAASSAFPGPFEAIVLQNYAGTCGFQEKPWMTMALEKHDVNSRAYRAVAKARTYLDAKQKPFIHLLDGGVSDNLGLRGPLEIIIGHGGIREYLENIGLQGTRRIAFIIVNAQGNISSEWGLLDKIPGLGAILGASSSVMLYSYNYETIELLRGYIEEWSAEENDLDEGRLPTDFYVVEVAFDAIEDDKERRYFAAIPTSLTLRREAVDNLREVASRILFGSKPFRELVRDLGGELSSPQP